MTKLSTQLTVDAGNPAVRIEVLDSQYCVRAKGYGRIDEPLPTGLYTVRYIAGDTVLNRDVMLLPNAPINLDDPPEMRFASVAPLDLTWTSHEYHQENAQRLSAAAPKQCGLGQGASMFVFVRDVHPGGQHPSAGLSLCALDGRQLLNLPDIVESCADATLASWEGQHIELAPNIYRMRLMLEGGDAVDMAVTICPGWQHQLFLLREGSQYQTGIQPVVDLPNATQLMTPHGQSFNPWSRVGRRVHPLEAGEDLRLAELARQALASGRQGLRTRDLEQMLKGKWTDPLLGIFGVHLLLMRAEPDLGLADDVVQRLRHSIIANFRHPDVDALALEIGRRRGKPVEMAPFTAPPMLRRSWNLLIRESAEQPGLIPSGSLSSSVADRLWGSGAWLTWEVPAEPPAVVVDDELILDVSGTDDIPAARIEELEDRVIIGGVTLPRRGHEPRATPMGFSERSPGVGEAAVGPASEADEAVPMPASAGDEDSAMDDSGVLELASDQDEGSAVAPPAASREPLSKLSYSELRHELVGLLPEIQKMPSPDDLDELTDRAGLDATELALLMQIVAVIRPRKTTTRDPLALNALVEQLGLPADRVRTTLAGLISKVSAAIAVHE